MSVGLNPWCLASRLIGVIPMAQPAAASISGSPGSRVVTPEQEAKIQACLHGLRAASLEEFKQGMEIFFSLLEDSIDSGTLATLRQEMAREFVNRVGARVRAADPSRGESVLEAITPFDEIIRGRGVLEPRLEELALGMPFSADAIVTLRLLHALCPVDSGKFSYYETLMQSPGASGAGAEKMTVLSAAVRNIEARLDQELKYLEHEQTTSGSEEAGVRMASIWMSRLDLAGSPFETYSVSVCIMRVEDAFEKAFLAGQIRFQENRRGRLGEVALEYLHFAIRVGSFDRLPSLTGAVLLAGDNPQKAKLVGLLNRLTATDGEKALAQSQIPGVAPVETMLFAPLALELSSALRDAANGMNAQDLAGRLTLINENLWKGIFEILSMESLEPLLTQVAKIYLDAMKAAGSLGNETILATCSQGLDDMFALVLNYMEALPETNDEEIYLKSYSLSIWHKVWYQVLRAKTKGSPNTAGALAEFLADAQVHVKKLEDALDRLQDPDLVGLAEQAKRLEAFFKAEGEGLLKETSNGR